MEFEGDPAELVTKIGDDYLQEIRTHLNMEGEKLLIMINDRGAVIYKASGGTVGTVVIEKSPGEIERRIIEGILSDEV